MPDPTRIAVIVGSLRKDSINRRLATAIARLAPAEFAFEQLPIGDLPLYNQDDDRNRPQSVQRLKASIEAAAGVLFVTPEYNRSVPGVLKNAIDHASRPYGSNSFAKKPVAVIGASVGAIGSAVSQSHLKGVCIYLDMVLLGQPEVYLHFKEGLIDDSGAIADEKVQKFLHGFTDIYVAWVKQQARTG